MKMIRQLFPLAIGGIALGSTEFMPMGLMRTMGESLALSDSQVGRFIAAYAIGVVVGAPTLVGLSTRFQPQRVLIALMLLFTLFTGLFAVMPSYSLLLVSRFFSGLPHFSHVWWADYSQLASDSTIYPLGNDTGLAPCDGYDSRFGAYHCFLYFLVFAKGRL